MVTSVSYLVHVRVAGHLLEEEQEHLQGFPVLVRNEDHDPLKCRQSQLTGHFCGRGGGALTVAVEY